MVGKYREYAYSFSLLTSCVFIVFSRILLRLELGVTCHIISTVLRLRDYVMRHTPFLGTAAQRFAGLRMRPVRCFHLLLPG